MTEQADLITRSLFWLVLRLIGEKLYPHDNAQNFVPLYALCPQRMVERLTKSKAPASVFSVVLCLKAYAFDKSSCFPSHKTIQAWCGGEIPLRTIRYAEMVGRSQLHKTQLATSKKSLRSLHRQTR